ncbi:TVP38/TMEM64 family protein [Vaginisenegalia massiliensis]|uniref:TVP38/TMEM64 family protein n=1 Tax=Vaginisenegalia massiliensis TaxID=2058294 RepID=UPI000F54A6DB|nr:VTT domain-containing protein [Vaginisenegalia massiliensis]
MKSISLEKRRKIIQITTTVGIILTFMASIFIAKSTYFKPDGGFHHLLQQVGLFGPVLYVCVLITQIIYPIIPFGLTNVIGDLVFGHYFGFALNCIGMLIGSSINFYLGRRFGPDFIRAFISDEQFDRYVGKMNQGKSFIRLLKIGFIAPVFPDDIFCMIAGMSKLSYKEFFRLVVIYRPLSLFVFTFLSSTTIQYLFKLIFG